ncbi:MAG: response regulator transcription factor [Planctomycetota bacterium]
MRVLVVEDYGPIRGAVVTALRDEGWSVDLAGDGEAALQHLAEAAYDLVVLDLMIPGIDGVGVLKRMRSQHDAAHVLVMTARDGVEERVSVLDAGADDYLVKPFAMEELVARARALLRRKYGRKSPVITVGPLTISTADQAVSIAERRVELTAREYALLEYFAYRADEIVTRADLHENLYGEQSMGSNVVDVYVGYLRKKLEAEGQPRLLHTRRGRGYVLTATELDDAPQPRPTT